MLSAVRFFYKVSAPLCYDIFLLKFLLIGFKSAVTLIISYMFSVFKHIVSIFLILVI